MRVHLPHRLDHLRLQWVWPAGPVPAWVQQCLQALQAEGGVHATAGPWAGGDGPAAPQPAPLEHGATLPALPLLLDPQAALPGLAGPCWLLSDGSGLPLDPAHPLQAGITGGHGIDLALWQRPAPGQPWALLRRLHIAASPRYARGAALLPGAVARLLRQAAIDQQLPARPAAPPGRPGLQPAAAPAPTSPGRRLWQSLRGWWLQEKLQWRARWLSEAWLIGVIDQPLASWATDQPMPPVRWLPKPPGPGYWADPMADASSPEHLLAEYFCEDTGIGHIERLQLGPAGVAQRQKLALGDGRHVSFPLVQTFDGRCIGLVETAALGCCQIHEVDAAGHWRVLATPLDGVAAADPALFRWDGRWWLAYTDIALGAQDNLCLLHAPALEGPWAAHANNPVKVDVTAARMAGGLFWHAGQLYRPAQNCLQTYGASVLLHRVLHCSPTAFVEEPVRELRPDPHGPCPDGMHTLSAWHGRTLVDGKRHVFKPQAVWRKLTRRWRPAGSVVKLPSAELR